MFDTFMKVATGRSHYAMLYLFVFMFVAPASMFTDYTWLDALGWSMTIILGIFIFITGVVNVQEGRQSFHWPRANAKLKSARLQVQTGNKGGRSYSPKIVCTFIVGGQEYEGAEYDFSSSYSAKVKSEKKVAEVKAMQPLLVHYKPEDPSINVIKPGLHFVAFLRLLVGLAAVVISAMSWLGYISY